MVKANLLQGEMDLQKEKLNNAVQSLETAMKGAKAQNQRELLLKILPLLSIAYEQKGDFRKALERQRYFETINIHDQSSQQHRETESFKHSQQAIERQLLLEDMQRQHTEDSQVIVEQKKVNLFLVATIFVLLSFLSLRHHLARSRFKELQQTQKQLYTHTRTGLRNLLRLKDNLPQTLKEKHEHFEQLYLMEMIHQPLSDKLRFAMFRVPFLETIHLQYGYKAGLSLEQKLGTYFKEFIHKPARLYHFSDCTFIYIEPNANSNNIPEWLSHKIQSLIDNFIYQNSLKIIDGKIHIGMAEIPFLPRAFTTIGDQELIEILLMATNAARQASETENGSQWVHLSAIDSTPAAYFAKTNLRDACLKGIDSGFIKVKTSAIRGINWQTLHGYTKKTASTIDKIDNKS